MPVSLVRFCPLAPAGWRKPEAVLLEFMPSSIPSRCAPMGASGVGLRSTDHGRATEDLSMSVYAREKGFGAERLGVHSSNMRDSCGASKGEACSDQLAPLREQRVWKLPRRNNNAPTYPFCSASPRVLWVRRVPTGRRAGWNMARAGG
jgi:hypothetical protein